MSLTSALAGVDWPAFLLAMAIVELTPGPNMGWLAAHAARTGRKAGLKAVAGITGGLCVQLIAAVTGLAALIMASPVLYEGLRWTGVVFMLFLAWEAWREDGSGVYHERDSAAGLWRGFAANVLNPKTFLFYLSMASAFADPARGAVWVQGLALGAVHILVSIGVHTGIVLFGHSFGARLGDYIRSWPVRLAFALMLAGFAVWLAVSTARH